MIGDSHNDEAFGAMTGLNGEWLQNSPHRMNAARRFQNK